jgi:hypothetical protein
MGRARMNLLIIDTRMFPSSETSSILRLEPDCATVNLVHSLSKGIEFTVIPPKQFTIAAKLFDSDEIRLRSTRTGV